MLLGVWSDRQDSPGAPSMDARRWTMDRVSGTWRTACPLAGALVATMAGAADLTLYADDDYQGRSVGVVIDEQELSVLNFDKRASSVVVDRGAWTLCTGEDY